MKAQEWLNQQFPNERAKKETVIIEVWEGSQASPASLEEIFTGGNYIDLWDKYGINVRGYRRRFINTVLEGDLDLSEMTVLTEFIYNFDLSIQPRPATPLRVKNITPSMKKWREKFFPVEMKRLEQELTAEKETTQQVLQTAQEQHQRQKQEITEAKDQIIRELKSEIDSKDQANQNYLARIKELEEQNALLQQKLDAERGIQEITTNLENQSLEENSERQLGTELTTQIIQNPN